MPLGSPIGSRRGIYPYNLRLIRRQVGVPLIVAAGSGARHPMGRRLSS